MKEFLVHIKQVIYLVALTALLILFHHAHPQQRWNGRNWKNQRLIGEVKEIQFGFAVLTPQFYLCPMCVFRGETEPCQFSQFNQSLSILALSHWKEASIICSGFRAENLQVVHSTLTKSQRSFAQT